MASHKHKSRSTRERNNPPPILAREYLESLGYRLTDEGIENEAKKLKILALQRIEDGSVPDFCFCSNLEETVGVILPHPFSHYQETLNVDEE